MILVVCDIAVVVVEDLSYLEYSRVLGVLCPERLFDVWNCVDSDAIKVEFLDVPANPVLQVLSYKRMLLVKVRKSHKPTVLHHPLVAPVSDVAVWMVVFGQVERVDLGEI